MKLPANQQLFVRRARLIRIAGLLAISIVVFFVVKYDVRTETRMKCLITGSDRVITNCFSLSSDVVKPNDVSRWAQQYGNLEITPGLCGWQTVGSSTARWFVPTIKEVYAPPRLVPEIFHRRSLSSSDDFEGRLMREFYRQISTNLAANEPVDDVLGNFLYFCPPMTVPDAQAMTIVCFYDKSRYTPPLTFEVTDLKQREAVVNCLRALRWIPTHSNLSRIASYVPPDFEIRLTDKSGQLRTYQGYWDIDALIGVDDGVLENFPPLRAQIASITGLTSAPKDAPADFEVIATYDAGRSRSSSWETTIAKTGEALQRVHGTPEPQMTRLQVSNEAVNDLWTAVQRSYFFELITKNSEVVEDQPTMKIQVTAHGKAHSVSIQPTSGSDSQHEHRYFKILWSQLLRAVPSPNKEQIPD